MNDKIEALQDLSEDALAAEMSMRDAEAKRAAKEWCAAQEATKAARRAETPLRKRYYELLDASREAVAERNRREEILRNIGR